MTADFDVDDAVCSTSEPTGSSAAGYRRVEIPASIRATTCPASRSVDANVVYDASGTSRADWSSLAMVRTRGRRTGTRRPPSVTEPCSLPWRIVARSASWRPFGPTSSATSSSISSAITSRPTAVEAANSPSRMYSANAAR